MRKLLAPIGLVVTLVALFVMLKTEIRSATSEGTGQSKSSHSWVNLQVWKHSLDTSLRILFDDKVIYEDKSNQTVEPERSDSYPSPKVLGRFAVEAKTEHTLLVEAKEVSFRSRLIWKADKDSQWVVVSYYSRLDQYKELPMITFSIQDSPAASK